MPLLRHCPEMQEEEWVEEWVEEWAAHQEVVEVLLERCPGGHVAREDRQCCLEVLEGHADCLEVLEVREVHPGFQGVE